jgi:minichromosome maintenance protein 10
MQVRQSPKAKGIQAPPKPCRRSKTMDRVSADHTTASSQSNVNWPPQSPLEALLSSPKGQKRWQEHKDRMTQQRDRDISPSPRKQPPSSSRALQDIMDISDNDCDDDDEEILQLQLQAIQAKLRLKKLQKQKSSQNTHHDDSRQSSENSDSPRKRQKTQSTDYDNAVQVTMSPVKSHMPPPTLPGPTSPARVRLGIDKGLKASDVSLKRARDGSTLASKNTVRTTLPAEPERPKQSFSDRIAANRLSAEQQQVKHERIERNRSQGFGLAAQSTPRPTRETAQSRPQLARTQSDRATNHLPTGSSTSSFSRSIPTPSASQSPFISSRAQPSSSTEVRGRSFRPTVGFSHDDTPTSTEPTTDGSCFESFSSLHLSKRLLPHTTLARALDGKEIYTLPRLLKEIKSPTYEPPDCETDFVVLAIIASKSTPFDTRPKHKQTSSVEDDNSGSTKFMIMRLTDLKWEVDLLLFDTAFEAFWKMTPGTVVALLNPTIMPPKTNQHSGKFSLKFASSEDSFMEIGSARDLGFCTSLKKDGKECQHWVNTRKNKTCDFHLELAISKTRASRMEVNTMYRPNSEHKKNSRVLPNGSFERRKDPSKRDYESNERYFMMPPGSRTTASLLDQDDFGKADAMRRRLKDKEKDRLLAEKLGQMGNGVGAEYLRTTTGVINGVKNTFENNTNEDAPLYKPSAAELGLVRKDASNIRLSPAKNRRKLFSILPGGTKSTAAGPEAMGWGGYAKTGLGSSSRPPRNPSPEKGQQRISAHTRPSSIASSMAGTSASTAEKSPKKARFQLERGIREPGRDSLGGGGEGKGVVEDSSDDLEII